MADRCPTCDRPLATQADYDSHHDGCMCERCLSLCWLTWTVQCQGQPVDWRARALDLQQRLDLAARITPFSAEPCPLCERVSGTCAMHRHHDEQSATTERQRVSATALEAALGEAINWIADRSDDEPDFVTRLRSAPLSTLKGHHDPLPDRACIPDRVRR